MNDYRRIIEYVSIRHPEVLEFRDAYTRVAPPLPGANNIRIYVCNCKLGYTLLDQPVQEYWCYAPSDLFSNYGTRLEELKAAVGKLEDSKCQISISS